MRKVTIFGKPSSGKSSLAKKLSKLNSISYYPLDLIEYKITGERVSRNEFMSSHEELVSKEAWIIDGLGFLEAFWQRIDSADTVIYVDLPYSTSYWWASKRFLMSFYKHPEGWPEGSSVFKGTVATWKYLRLSPNFWNEELLSKIREKSAGKTFIHIKKVSQIAELCEQCFAK